MPQFQGLTKLELIKHVSRLLNPTLKNKYYFTITDQEFGEVHFWGINFWHAYKEWVNAVILFQNTVYLEVHYYHGNLDQFFEKIINIKEEKNALPAFINILKGSDISALKLPISKLESIKKWCKRSVRWYAIFIEGAAEGSSIINNLHKHI